MTTRITIKNNGPALARIRYYTEARQFKEQSDLLQPGESLEVDVWDGHLPVIWAERQNTVQREDEEDPRFFRSPPAATYR